MQKTHQIIFLHFGRTLETSDWLKKFTNKAKFWLDEFFEKIIDVTEHFHYKITKCLQKPLFAASLIFYHLPSLPSRSLPSANGNAIQYRQRHCRRQSDRYKYNLYFKFFFILPFSICSNPLLVTCFKMEKILYFSNIFYIHQIREILKVEICFLRKKKFDLYIQHIDSLFRNSVCVMKLIV